MKIFLVFPFFLITLLSNAQNTGIGTTNPHPSAALEITDTSRGILIPRMTMSQRNAIQNPAEGLMVYQTDSAKGFWYWDQSSWKKISNKLYTSGFGVTIFNDTINFNNNNQNDNGVPKYSVFNRAYTSGTSYDSLTLSMTNEVWEFSLNHNNGGGWPGGDTRSISISFFNGDMSGEIDLAPNSFYVGSSNLQITPNSIISATSDWNAGYLSTGKIYWNLPSGTKIKIKFNCYRNGTQCCYPTTSWDFRIIR